MELLFKKFLQRIIITICFIALFIGLNISVEGQTPEKENSRLQNNKLSIKPNSRDLNVSIRDNSFKRFEKPKKQITVKGKKVNHHPKSIRKSTDQIKRKEMMQRRKQMIHQRNSKRR